MGVLKEALYLDHTFPSVQRNDWRRIRTASKKTSIVVDLSIIMYIHICIREEKYICFFEARLLLFSSKVLQIL